MNSENRVKQLIDEWKAQGLSMSEIIINTAEAELEWCYVWGATGQQCTPSGRRTYASRTSCPSAESILTLNKCQVTRQSNPKSDCNGCVWFPGGERTLMDDCQGFVKQTAGRVGITFSGGGCTSMWNNDGNWSEKGLLSDMPDVLCCVFMQNQKDHKTMEHIGWHVGNGNVIHCSGEVKRGRIADRGWTHYAIPKALGGDPSDRKPTLRKGDSGTYVTLLQTMLIQRGYPLPRFGADGKFGGETLEAVKAFQRANGLNADGVVGSATWEALDSVEPLKSYTVVVPHLTFAQAEALIAQYPDAEKTEEKG